MVFPATATAAMSMTTVLRKRHWSRATKYCFQLQSSLFFKNNFIRQVNSRFAYTDYQHAEIEGGEVGTTFKNKSHEGRLELMHQPLFDWKGGLSLHYKYSDFAAEGAEAFTPPSDST
ncbi:hypothetical protein ALON55S_08505 [Alishewanella longhuensis]